MTLIIILFVLIIMLSVLELLFANAYFKPLKFIILIALILLAALRPADVDRDFNNYVTFFQNVDAPITYFQNYLIAALCEPTYYLIPSVLKFYFTTIDYTFWTFFIYALLGVSTKLLGINKMGEFFFLSVIIYGTSFFFLHEMTQIRAGVASGIFLCSIPLLYERRYLKYILCIMIAFLFHYSSIILLPLLFLQTRKINIKVYSCILALTLVLAFIDTSFINTVLSLNTSFLSNKTESYKDLADLGVGTFGDINKFNILFIVQFLMTAFLLAFITKIQVKNKYAPLLLKIQILGLFSFQLFSAIPTLAFRVSEMLLIVQVITFSFCIYIFRSKWIGFGICLLYAVGYYYLNIYYIKLFQDFEYMNGLLLTL